MFHELRGKVLGLFKREDLHRLYNELSWLWPVISPPKEYIEETGEECDEGPPNGNDFDGCDDNCNIVNIAFVTPRLDEKGNLGGLTGADNIYRGYASQAGLYGADKYIAWLSSSTESFASRFTSPYKQKSYKF